MQTTLTFEKKNPSQILFGGLENMRSIFLKNSERDINSLIHLTQIYSEDIVMSFRLEKCDWMVVKRGKTDGVELPASHIADI